MRGKKLLSLLLSTTLIGTMLPTAALATVDSGADSSPLVCTTDEGGAAENHEENTLVSTPANTEGNKTTPGWEDNNEGHPKRIQETFDFVVDGIAYKKLDDTTVEVAPWYWKWTHSCND